MPLSSFYPYGKSNGDSSLRDTITGSAGIYLSEEFVFYSSHYSQIYVSDHVATSSLLVLAEKVDPGFYITLVLFPQKVSALINSLGW